MRRIPYDAAQGRLVATRTRAERVNPDLQARLIELLRGRGWVHRGQLRTELGISDDLLRALARFSSGQVIGSSSRGGYGLVIELPSADVHAWVVETRSRAKELNRRVAEVYRVLNGRNVSAFDGAA